MGTLLTPNDNLEFPPRRDRIQAEWVPIYIEPMVGSGEKLSVAVAVANVDGFLVVPVVALNRLSCVYGKEANALIHAAYIAIQNLNNVLAEKGQEALHDWQPPVDGVSLGRVRIGAGDSLEEIARTGLTACSSLVEKLAESDETIAASEGVSPSRLERFIKERVIARKPALEVAFARKFQPNQNARSAIIGFVGQRIVANFGLLVPGYVSIQVRDAKAKLWDLAQVQEYVKNDEFGLSHELNRFELLLNRVREDDPAYSERQIHGVQEAIIELEAEADKKEIRCRALTSPDEIAEVILSAEAA